MLSRREFLKLSGVSTFALYLAARGNPVMRALAASAKVGLSDPTLQPKFANPVPDALAPGFIYKWTMISKISSGDMSVSLHMQ